MNEHVYASICSAVPLFYQNTLFSLLIMSKNILPYGSWKSPLSSDLITSESVHLDQVRIYNGEIYWLERRPAESGRSVIVRYRENSSSDVLPSPYNARSRVHEYGGGVYCACEQGVFFVNDADQDIYLAAQSTSPERITNAEQYRFADLSYDSSRGRILCICEHHHSDESEPSNSLVSVDVNSGTVTTLKQGDDFYSSPRLSHDGRRLAWLSWNHPNMPWDGTELWLAELDAEGMPQHARRVAGDAQTSIFQPEWSPDDSLYFVSDASGWWNLARLDQTGVVPVTRLHSEFGLPQWVFGQTTYAFSNSHTIFCTRITNGIGQLSKLDVASSDLVDIDIHRNAYTSICADENSVCLVAASENEFAQVIRLVPGCSDTEVIAASCSANIDHDYISSATSISFETRHGDKAHAIYYPPTSKDHAAPAGELPPLIVLSHGGPTAAADAALDLRKQYWTSRGFAIMDVNYSGSTGYGRAYRQRLEQNWGLRDAEDLCDAANYCADKGLADKNRMIIKGSSAGGYTVLAALTFHDTFACGASYYGISDLESLLAETHKFESRYTDRLVGSYTQHRQRYYQRSPINYVEHLSCPVIFFQGAEDRVVPPEQAEKMFTALKEKGIAVSYVLFENEQHGFRRAATIKTTLEAELYFYSVIFGITPTDELAGVDIANIDT